MSDERWNFMDVGQINTRPPVVIVKPGGEIELPDGVSLEETIRVLWEGHAKNALNNYTDPSFFGSMAFLETRLLAEQMRGES